MTTVDLYKKHKAGGVSREKFLYEVRRDSMLPFITNLTSYSDAVQILKNKGIIREESFPEESAYNQGKAANKSRKNYTDNPYSKDYELDKYEEWTDGWIDAESEGQMAHDNAKFRRERGGIDEAEGSEMYYAIFNILGELGDGYPLYFTTNSKEDLVNTLNRTYKEMTGEKYIPYSLEDIEPHIYMGKRMSHFISDDWSSVTDNEEAFKNDLSYLPNAVKYRANTSVSESEGEYNPDAAWQEGYDSFEAGSHQEENPYEGDTSEHKNWDMGYEKAQHDGPGLNEDAAANVEAVVNEYTPELLDALNRRKQNQEDVAAYRKVESLIEKMAAKLGCRTDVPFMEDEMFSGQYSAKDVIPYIKEMFISELNDMGYEKAQHDGPGLNEDPVSDKVEKAIRDKKLDPKLVKKAAEDAERGNSTALATLIATAGMMKEGRELTLDTVNPYEFRKGMQWELGYATLPAPNWDQNTVTDEDFAKAGKKVLKNLSSDPNYYTILISNKGEKPKKVKEVKVEEDGMAKIKGVEKVTANVQTSLGKKERGKKHPEGVKEMRGTKRTFSKIKLMKEGDLNAALDKNLRKLFK